MATGRCWRLATTEGGSRCTTWLRRERHPQRWQHREDHEEEKSQYWVDICSGGDNQGRGYPNTRISQRGHIHATYYMVCTSAHASPQPSTSRCTKASCCSCGHAVAALGAIGDAIGRLGARGWIWSWRQPFCALCIPETATRKAGQSPGLPMASRAGLASCQTRTGWACGRSRRGHYRETRGGWIPNLAFAWERLRLCPSPQRRQKGKENKRHGRKRCVGAGRKQRGGHRPAPPAPGLTQVVGSDRWCRRRPVCCWAFNQAPTDNEEADGWRAVAWWLAQAAQLVLLSRTPAAGAIDG